MKKKALMASTAPPGVGQFNMPNIRMLVDMGYQVDDAADFTNTSYWPAERKQRFRDDIIALGGECFQIDFSRNPLRLFRLMKAYRETVALLRKNGYELVHTHTPIASAIVRLAAHKTGTRVIYTAHGFHFYTGAPLINWLFYYPVEKYLSKYTDVLITINHEDYQRAREKFSARKTCYIPGVGLDPASYAVCWVDREQKRAEVGVRPDDFVLLTAGVRNAPDRCRGIVEALRILKDKGTIGNVVWLMAGEGGETLEKQIAEAGLTEHVRLSGVRTDVDELCEAADCFLDPSADAEPALASLEAMAAGLPLIFAGDCGIAVCAEDGKAGCRVAPGDAAQIAAAMEKMRDDGAFAARCGSNNWKASKMFDLPENGAIRSGGYRHLHSVLVRRRKRAELGIGPSDYLVISVGEVNDNKNHQVILKAIKDLPGVKCVIAGEGRTDTLRKQAEAWGVSDRAIIAGYRTDVKELLWASDCFVFPSKREGLGIAALEALSAGLPIIAHDIGGLREFCIDGVTGWLCKTNGAEEYRRLIEKAMTADRLTEYREIVKRYESSTVNAIMRKIYESAE